MVDYGLNGIHIRNQRPKLPLKQLFGAKTTYQPENENSSTGHLINFPKMGPTAYFFKMDFLEKFKIKN
jgi:hypothetical protein